MRTLTTLAAVVALQSALVGAAVAPQLSAHVMGDTYRFRVAPLDPMDPFRGAYVTLDYTDLQRDDTPNTDGDGGAAAAAAAARSTSPSSTRGA